MKKFIAGTILGLSIVTLGLGATKASAESTTIDDGTNTGNVKINGTLGANNTDPTAPINEGSGQWLNVTLDTDTIFYNTATSTAIESPTYNIKNNSGRPVNVKVKTFTHDDAIDITKIGALNATFTRAKTDTNAAASVSTNLITSGALTTDFTSASTLQLANSEGKLAKDDTTGAYSTDGTFAYGGSVTSKINETIKPTFTMTLSLQAQSW